MLINATTEFNGNLRFTHLTERDAKLGTGRDTMLYPLQSITLRSAFLSA